MHIRLHRPKPAFLISSPGVSVLSFSSQTRHCFRLERITFWSEYQVTKNRERDLSPFLSFGYILRLGSKKRVLFAVSTKAALMMRISVSKWKTLLPPGKTIIKYAHSSSAERKHVTTKLLGSEKSWQSYGTFNQKISKQSHTILNQVLVISRMQSGKCPFL